MENVERLFRIEKILQAFKTQEKFAESVAKMSLRCSVKGCITDRSTGDHPMLHSFPFKYPELLKKWLEKIELVAELSSSSRVCSLHFDSGCFENRRYQDRLLPDAIPFDSKVSLNRDSCTDFKI